MKRLEVEVTATADIEETWVIEVDDETAAAIVADPSEALDHLADGMVSITDRTTGNEQDREVKSVTEVRPEPETPGRPMPGWPMPNDVINGGPQDARKRIVIASVSYISDERGELVLVLLLEKEAPYFTVAHYAVTDFDPAAAPDIAPPYGPSYAAGEIDVLGRFMNIVPAIEEYQQSGGSY